VTAPAPPRGRFVRLQAFRDALDYRRARLAGPCGGCQAAPGDSSCEDYVRDLDLVAEYERAAGRELAIAPRSLMTDGRVVAAADLLARRHAPATMPAGQLRVVLGLYQRRLARLLDACHVAAQGNPPTPDQVAVGALAALADDGDAGDFAGRLAAALASVATGLGSSAALVAGRPGSWEADLVLRLVRGTAGSADEDGKLPGDR
jgi:hypothetical protein